MVPKVGVAPTRSCDHMALNHARLLFRHVGIGCDLRGVVSGERDPARWGRAARRCHTARFPGNRVYLSIEKGAI